MLRLNEAFLEAKRKGIRIQKQELAALLWKNSSLKSRRQNMVNLQSGAVARVSQRQVKIICDTLKCDANFLFDINK